MHHPLDLALISVWNDGIVELMFELKLYMYNKMMTNGDIPVPCLEPCYNTWKLFSKHMVFEVDNTVSVIQYRTITKCSLTGYDTVVVWSNLWPIETLVGMKNWQSGRIAILTRSSIARFLYVASLVALKGTIAPASVDCCGYVVICAVSGFAMVAEAMACTLNGYVGTYAIIECLLFRSA